MILRAIRLSGWRCFIEEVALGPFAEGLNIIHAPNGTGKSTLFEALRRALLDGHRVTGRDIDAIRPWGRELTPRVVVEFADQGTEYRLSKQYLDSPSARLERQEDGRYRPVAEGVAADEQTRAILSRNPPGRGLARLENWGLAQILWAAQGALTLSPLTGDVVADIRQALGAQVAAAGSGELERRLEEQYLRYFTPRGKPKTGNDGPRLSQLVDDLAAAQQSLAQAREAHQAYEQGSERLEALRAQRLFARHAADELTKALRQAAVAADSYRRLTGEAEQRREKASTAEALHSQLRQHLDLIASTAKALTEAQDALSALETALPAKQREALERQRDATQRQAELEDARKGRQAVDAAAQLAATARGFTDCSRDLARFQALLTKVHQATEDLAGRTAARTALVAPDAATLRAIRKAVQERDSSQLSLQASLITLEIVPAVDGTIEVISGETPGAVPATAGVPFQTQGSPEVVVDLPSQARLRAWGPTGSVEEHRQARTKAEGRLRQLSAPFSTADVEELEHLAEQAAQLDRQVDEAGTRLKTLLAGRTEEELRRESHALEQTRRQFLEAYPAWEAASPEVSLLVAAAEDVRRTFVEQVEAAEGSWQRAQQAAVEVAGQQQSLIERLGDRQRALTDLLARLDDLTRDALPPTERQAELGRLSMAWEAARTRLREIEEQLAEFADDPSEQVSRFEAQLEDASRDSEKARDLETRAEARLEEQASQGPYSVLATAEERVAQLQQEVRREQLRADAIRLLRDTVAACRAEAIAAVSRPVELVATRTFQRIAGRRLGTVQIGDSFTPVGVVPAMLQQAAALESLSGGEQEQLFLATRLALAEVLARDQRQLVVLDDVLTATDTGRLARVMSVLQDAAQRLQVLVLTCHPERYRGLQQAKFLDLEEAVSAG